MKRALITSFLLVSTCAAAASAESLDGSLTLGANIHRAEKAKANEYRSLGDGVFGGLDLDYRDKDVYTNLQGTINVIDSPNATQKTDLEGNIDLKGGVTDSFKVNLFYNEMPHNFTFGAKTYLTGIGSATLVKPNATANPTAADYTNSFDYAISKKNMGVGGEISLKSPFFFGVQADRSTTVGLMPFALGTSLREVPAPIDYTTNNLYLQTGYRSDRVIFTIDGLISRFSNENDRFSSFYSTSNPTTYYPTYYGYLPPDNNYYKVGSSLTYRIPLMDSTLMARANYSMLRDDVTLFENSGPIATQYPTARNWGGRVNYTTASTALTSRPMNNLDTRIFFNFLNKKNEGPEDFNYGTTDYTTERFDYNKRNMGVDVGYKLPAKTKLSAGYEYLNLHRAIREDAPSTEDHTMYMQVKNDLFDWMSAKVRYQRLMRSSDFEDAALYANEPTGGVANTSAANTSLYYKIFFRPADTANRNQDSIKVGLDFEPIHGLSLGVEYAYKKDDYTNNYLGILDAERHEGYFDATYAASVFKLNAYADIEVVESNSRFRQLPRTTGTSATLYADPMGVSNSNNFNWTSKRQDVNYALGLKGDVDVIKNILKASAGYRYEQADGSNDFTTNVTGVVFNNVSRLDDYLKQAVDVKLTCNVTPAFIVTAGYLYEHLKYTDDADTGYTYIVGTNYLSGAYASPSYNASMVYLSGTFKF